MKENDTNPLHACSELLIQKKLSLAFAESATAGRLAAEFSLIPDAGKFLKGSIVCYDADLKCTLLNVSREEIKKHTPESEEVTASITKGLQQLIPADIHIGCTGLIAPGGSETADKPVGTMFIYALKDQNLLFKERKIFQGGPEDIVKETVALVALRLYHSLLI